MAAAVSCLRLGRGWRGAGSSVGRRRLCQGPRHSESDLELHRGYSGFLPRYRAARSLLFTQEGEEKFESYVEAKVGGGFLSKMILLADLEHPLFLKYNFDVKDFMEGAKHAFETIMGDAYHSKEFADYVSDYGEEVVENQKEVYGEGTLEKVSEILQQRHGEEPKQQDHSHVENLESENQRSDGDEEGGGNSDVSHISGKGQPPQSLSKEDFLYSVCTESGFQDFVDILKLEMRVKDKFAIFEENIESYFMSRALINVEEEDEEHDNKNGSCTIFMPISYLRY